jgi:Ca2+-binding EF-hand superfamily protein
MRFPRTFHVELRAVLVIAGAAATCLAARSAFADDADEKERKMADQAAKAQEVSKEEQAKLAAEQFARLDKNADGYLRAAELPEGALDRFDRDGDGTISKSEYVEVSSRPAGARRLHRMRDARARAADALRTFDADKNGSVERKEYPGTDGAFRKADRNKDAALSPQELLALAEDELEDIRKTMRNPGRYDFLVCFDLNSDNRVTADEFDGNVVAFRKFDTDKDGTVTYDELFPERMARMEDQPKPKIEDRSAIELFDADKDGKVTREEYKGGDAAWVRLDKNGDGVLTTADR